MHTFSKYANVTKQRLFLKQKKRCVPYGTITKKSAVNAWFISYFRMFEMARYCRIRMLNIAYLGWTYVYLLRFSYYHHQMASGCRVFHILRFQMFASKMMYSTHCLSKGIYVTHFMNQGSLLQIYLYVRDFIRIIAGRWRSRALSQSTSQLILQDFFNMEIT